MITLKNVTLRRGSKVLLDGVSATINPGEQVGLVGRNGAGKSTLFALLNGTLHEDGGDFFMPPQWRMAQVAQHMPETDEPATDFVLDGDTRLSSLRDKLSKAERTGDGMAIAQAHADLQDAGAHDAPARAQLLLISARSAAALRALAGRFLERLQGLDAAGIRASITARFLPGNAG